MYCNSFKNMYENNDVKSNGLKYTYFVKTYVCDIVEIDRKDVAYWIDKAVFHKRDLNNLISILEYIASCLNNVEFSILEARMFEFGEDEFSKPNVMFYKDKRLAISDGRSGRVIVDNKEELNSLIKLLKCALDEC